MKPGIFKMNAAPHLGFQPQQVPQLLSAGSLTDSFLPPWFISICSVSYMKEFDI